jgi:hypothetical protein
MKNNTITSSTVEPVYFVGSSDPTISVEKSFELYDNVLNPPKKYNALKLTNSTVAARCYSNFNSSGTASKYKIKGESDTAYTTLTQPDVLDSFTLDNHEGETVDLSYSCSTANIMYRVTRISGEKETLLVDTPGQSYTDSNPVTNGEDVIYRVTPYRLFTRIKFLGTPMEIKTFSILVTEPPTEPPTDPPTEPSTEAATDATASEPSETTATEAETEPSEPSETTA